MKTPSDYLEKVYSGILGKLIGVYLGRPFEGWTYERIMEELGPIKYYIHDKFDLPLVVTDDDVAGTFTFIRALEDHVLSKKLRSNDIGKTWLNYIVENRSILWWGGNGISTEHTAWLNLKNGITAPESGSIEKNGKTISEQIGAQIFIDGWALVSPGNPVLASEFAEKAARVSHDGEAVYAAQLWAAMESEAFISNDIDHLLDIGLSVIPKSSMITSLVQQIRIWHKKNKDWHYTRELIAKNFGYDKFYGNCHVIPNHAIMIMTILYANQNFQLGQNIVNTSGWDTDCNAGNVGCLQGIMLGLDGLNHGFDWRGPIADRMLISSADGGNSINDAVRMSYYISNLGRSIYGEKLLPDPKEGAQFHFSLPGSRQGFKINEDTDQSILTSLSSMVFKNSNALAVKYKHLGKNKYISVSSPTFTSIDVLKMRTYDLMASPLIYSGQLLTFNLHAGIANTGDLLVCIRIKCFSFDDVLISIDSDNLLFQKGDTKKITWQIPDCESRPIAEVGLIIKSENEDDKGSLVIDYMKWEGEPKLVLKRLEGEGDFWHRSWINSVDHFSKETSNCFKISQDRGLGLIIHGTRLWKNYKVEADLVLHLGKFAGLTARTQGLRRYYAARLCHNQLFQIIRVFDDNCKILSEVNFSFELDKKISVSLSVNDKKIFAMAGEKTLSVIDDSDESLSSGGIGLFVFEGTLSTELIRIN